MLGKAFATAQALHDSVHRMPPLRRHVLRADQAGRVGRGPSSVDGAKASARRVKRGTEIPRHVSVAELATFAEDWLVT